MTHQPHDLFDPLEEDTNPGVLEKHEGFESGKQPSVPPYAELQTQVEQLLGGHAQLRAVVDSMRRDLDTLLRESRRQELEHNEERGMTRRGQRRMAKVYGALFVLAEAAQFWLHLHHGGN